MEKELRSTYEGLLFNVEQPIRQIVRGIWHMPFVVDTGHTCSGHMLQTSYKGKLTQEQLSRAHPYPHDARLEIFYSLDERLEAERDSFRDELKDVRAHAHGRELSFNEMRAYPTSEYSRCSAREGETPTMLYEGLFADFEPVKQDIKTVYEIEDLLEQFWEQVRVVVAKYSELDDVPRVKDPDFRNLITWDTWKTLQQFRHHFDKSVPPPVSIGLF
jgi:hypothetical protein